MEPNSGKKKCPKCGKTRSVEMFNFRNKAKGLRHSVCKNCTKRMSAEHYEKNKDKLAVENRYNRSIRVKYSTMHVYDIKKNSKCANCGQTDPRLMDFHHIDPKTKKYSISEMTRRGMNIDLIDTEIAKCKILCPNCHALLHHEERYFKLATNRAESRQATVEDCDIYLEHYGDRPEAEEVRAMRKRLLKTSDSLMVVRDTD